MTRVLVHVRMLKKKKIEGPRTTFYSRVKGVGTKAPFNGGFAFAWLSTKLCARLQRPDLFMNRPSIEFLI